MMTVDFRATNFFRQKISFPHKRKRQCPTSIDSNCSAFRVSDEQNTTREYFCCSSRDEMAKWMNKMGLAAINFEINDSKIAGFNKGFIDSRENSPVSTPKFLRNLFQVGNKKRSTGESEIESDKDSVASNFDLSNEQNPKEEFFKLRSSSTSISKDLNFVKTHHRTSSSPVNFTTILAQENQQFYVRSFSRRSDSESSNDFPAKRSFYNPETSAVPTPNENFMLNSSGGFSTTAPVHFSPPTNEQIETFSPGFTLCQPEQTTENQIFTFDDQNQQSEDFSQSSSSF